MIAIVVYSFIGVAAAVLAYFLYFKERGREVQSSLFLDREPLFESKARRTVNVDTSPISGACLHCGERITLPFKCKFCGSLFCSDHRLPENHSCGALNTQT